MAKNRITQALSRLFQREQPTSEGSIIETGNPAAIRDGVDYSLPVLLPRDMEASLRASGKLTEYLTESARDNFRFQFDSPYAADLPIDPVTEDPLREWSWATRGKVLTNCHAAYHRNPLANRGVKYVAAFVVGEGFNLTCKALEVKALLEAFIDNPENAIREYEPQAVIDLQVDGELFLRYFSAASGDAKGQTVVAPLRPWECESITTERGFFRRVVSYHFQRYTTEGDAPTGGQRTETEDIPAAEMQHVKINAHGYDLRGRPELYPILPWLKAYKDWLENRARQNYWRGALLWLVRVQSTVAGVIAAVAGRWKKPPTPGSVAIESDKVEVQALNNPVGAGDASEDGRQIKLMTSVGMGLPEYMLADGSNANLASSTSQELPALTTFGTFQRIMVEQVWYPMFRRVIQNAIEAGVLAEDLEECDPDGETVYEEPDPAAAPMMPMMQPTPPQANGNGALPVTPEPSARKAKRIKALDAFDVAYAPLQQTDPVNIAQAMNLALTNELVSRETASTEMGFDYGRERKRMKGEMAQKQAEIAAGLRPDPLAMMQADRNTSPDDDDKTREAVAREVTRQLTETGIVWSNYP